MLQSNTRAWITVDRNAILHNLKEVEKLLTKQNKVMAVVKANAYGHGDKVIAKLLENHGVDFFAVSSVDEALNLREAGIRKNILILGYTPPQHFHYLIEYDLVQNFLSLEYAIKCNEYAKSRDTKIRGHIKADTGMARLGTRVLDNDYNIEAIKSIYSLSSLSVEGIFSHFSVADETDEENLAYTAHQIELFERVLSDLRNDGIDPGLTHMQNSYGVLNYQLPYDYVRPGLLLLGLTSDDSIPINTKPDFIPALSLKANISYVKEVKEGSSVSYGRHFKAHKDMKVATVSIGYADGIPRSASNLGMSVLVKGKRCPIIGNICMDQLMIDVSDVDAYEGDIVTLIGKDGNDRVTIDEWSRITNTINNDLLCHFSSRVPRFYTALQSKEE